MLLLMQMSYHKDLDILLELSYFLMLQCYLDHQMQNSLYPQIILQQQQRTMYRLQVLEQLLQLE